MIEFLEPTETAKIIPLCQGYMRQVKKPAVGFLDSSYRTRVEAVVLTFHIPESILCDFVNYVERMKGMEGQRSGWNYEPIIRSLIIGIRDKGEYDWDWPINKPRNGPSIKSRIKRIWALSKKESLISSTIETHEIFWEKIVERAAFYDITPGELCLSCIEYHAGLERRHQEQQKPKTSFDAFERGLAKDARQMKKGTI